MEAEGAGVGAVPFGRLPTGFLVVLCDLLPAHAYVSSDIARNALAMRLIAGGRATYGGMVALKNS